MKKSRWKYANAEGHRTGTMQCQKCGQKITDGEYRYKEMDHHFEFIGYVSHEHRSCADKGDAGWLMRENAIVFTSPTRATNTKPTEKMKITISHDQGSIDPSATYSDEQFAEVRKALEAEYEKAILAEYPESEIDFIGTDTTYAIRVTGTGMDDPSEIEENVQSICERVFETGNFWI